MLEAMDSLKEVLIRDLRFADDQTLVWSVALYRAETWALRAEDIKRIEVFEVWVWRKMQKLRLSERRTNDEVLEMVDEKWSLMDCIIKPGFHIVVPVLSVVFDV